MAKVCISEHAVPGIPGWLAAKHVTNEFSLPILPSLALLALTDGPCLQWEELFHLHCPNPAATSHCECDKSGGLSVLAPINQFTFK